MLNSNNDYSQSPPKSNQKSSLSADKFNQLTKLNEEEENVDFLQMFSQYQAGARIHQQNQVQYYEGNQRRDDPQSERLSIEQNYQMQQAHTRKQEFEPLPKTKGAKNKAIRPGSATVSGNRILQNQLVKKAQYGGVSANQIDQVSYSYQQPVQNLIPPSKSQGIHVGNQRGSVGFVSNQGRQGVISRKRTRPQSAAKNQLQPSKALHSVTNFTYQKAKQNLNQRAYVPESLKNTDKERLYEEKINLKKQLNEMTKENQFLRTQLQSQQGLIKRKDNMVQQVMKTMFYPNANVPTESDKFLQEFQQKEIYHQNVGGDKFPSAQKIKNSKSIKNQGAYISKDTQVTSLKLKMKEINEQLILKEKELLDLKQTLKFTKVKEYETELALNVQESQRLRILLEHEIQKPKIDPRYVAGLKQQLRQYQQIINNLQQNQGIQQENYEKLNKKLISQIKKFAKQKEARKKLNEKNQRLEKKVMILQNKLQGGMNYQMRNTNAFSSNKQFQQEMDHYNIHWKQRFDEQSMFIARLMEKMKTEFNIDPSQLDPIFLDMSNSNDYQEMYMQPEDKKLMDYVVTFGKNKALNISQYHFESYDQLKDTLRREFKIEEDFQIKILGDNGGELELSGATWEQLKASGTTQVQLAVELNKGDMDEDEEVSNYEEDDFEMPMSEKTMLQPISKDKVVEILSTIRYVCQIKKIKKQDILKFLLHGDDRQKQVSISHLEDCISRRLRIYDSINLCKFLIEKPNDEGKVVQLTNHNEACTMRRKELSNLIQELIEDYPVYNGLAITSMLKRVQDMLEGYRDELADELDDQDYEDTGMMSFKEILKSMKLVGLYVDSFDAEIVEFLKYLAMRQSSSLENVNYKEFLKVFDENYNLLDDPSRWSNEDDEYEASDDGSEMKSDRPSPIENEDERKDGTALSNIDELEQNELLEKVDEILQQIVKRLPETHKIKTLTSFMMPYLQPIYDQDIQKQYLIISQNSFIEFLIGQQQNQLGLQIDESHLICLLHLLVQEDESEQDNNKFILYEEFIELVKTYMKKELIMQQSKQLGINYDILSKESVEFLFQIRSGLMHDNSNINEPSDDEEMSMQPAKKQKSVPSQIREIFKRIISRKNVQLNNQSQGQTSVEVMDFDQMLDTLFMRMGIHCPGNKSQEELKFLMCLDFKYLEMVMLVKFDKIMHDLDYISIDLLRQAQDQNLTPQRDQLLNQLRQIRDQQMSKMKSLRAAQSTEGASEAAKQEKKRKRPDDKRAKKATSNSHNMRAIDHDQDLKRESYIVDDVSPDQKSQDKGYPAGSVNVFDNIDVNLDTDINHKDKRQGYSEDEEEEDYLQDDIPIDESDEEEDEKIEYDHWKKPSEDMDDIISDNYLNMNEKKEEKVEVIDDNAISMDHSDDISSPIKNDGRKEQQLERQDIEEEYDMPSDNYEDDIVHDQMSEKMDEQLQKAMNDQFQAQMSESDVKESIKSSKRSRISLDKLPQSMSSSKNQSLSHSKNQGGYEFKSHTQQELSQQKKTFDPKKSSSKSSVRSVIKSSIKKDKSEDEYIDQFEDEIPQDIDQNLEIPHFEEKGLTGTASGLIPAVTESAIVKSQNSSKLIGSGMAENIVSKEDSVQVVEDDYISDDFEEDKKSEKTLQQKQLNQETSSKSDHKKVKSDEIKVKSDEIYDEVYDEVDDLSLIKHSEQDKEMGMSDQIKSEIDIKHDLLNESESLKKNDRDNFMGKQEIMASRDGMFLPKESPKQVQQVVSNDQSAVMPKNMQQLKQDDKKQAEITESEEDYEF